VWGAGGARLCRPLRFRALAAGELRGYRAVRGNLLSSRQIDAVIAWRVMLLALLGREVPEMPAAWVFSPQECRLLETLPPRVAPETMGGKKNSAWELPS